MNTFQRVLIVEGFCEMIEKASEETDMAPAAAIMLDGEGACLIHPGDVDAVRLIQVVHATILYTAATELSEMDFSI